MFKGLEIEKLETQWEQYPVVMLSFASCKSNDLNEIVKFISTALSQQEFRFGLADKAESVDDNIKPNTNFNLRLERIIETAYQQTSKQVVVLIDEYDALMLNTIEDLTAFAKIRLHINNLLAPLKDLDPILNFVLITGTAHFSQMYMFDEVNNIIDITMSDKYAELCGFTDLEIETYFADYLAEFAARINKTIPEIMVELKRYCGGYQFSNINKQLYNPYCVVQTLANFTFSNYWAKEEKTSPLVNFLNTPKYQDWQDNMRIINDYDMPYEIRKSCFLLVLRRGYLSMKSYSKEYDQYVVGIPNEDVKTLFGKSASTFRARRGRWTSGR